MSIALMTRAWEHAPYSGSELLVLLALCDFANDEGECFPSQATLAAKTRMSERQVRRIIKQFEIDGAVRKEVEQDGKRRRNRYWISIGQDVLSLGLTAGHDESLREDTVMAPEPSIEPSEEPSPAAPSKEQRDRVWDSLVEVFSQPATQSDRRRFGKTVRELLTDTTLTPEQVAVAIPFRALRFREVWPGLTLTLEALVKHWSALAPRDDGVLAEEVELEDDGTGRRTF